MVDPDKDFQPLAHRLAVDIFQVEEWVVRSRQLRACEQDLLVRAWCRQWKDPNPGHIGCASEVVEGS